MKTKNNFLHVNHALKRLSIWAILVTLVLSIPLFAQFPWTRSDFVFAGCVLFGSATVYELVTSSTRSKGFRRVIGSAIVLIVLLIWAWAVA